MLVGRNDKKYLKDVKAIPGYLQHTLVIADINKRKLRINRTNNKVVKSRVWKLKDLQSNFEQKDGELIDIKVPSLWKSYQDSILKHVLKYEAKNKIQKNRGGT